MGDMGDLFNDLKEHSKQKRSNNREKSAMLLRTNGISFSEHNGGAHLVVYGKFGTIDFWPGTGRWTVRAKDNKHGPVTKFGVGNLINYLQGDK